jgi:hypothetical protein
MFIFCFELLIRSTTKDTDAAGAGRRFPALLVGEEIYSDAECKPLMQP